MMRLRHWLVGALLALVSAGAAAEELVVSNYGDSANGMPFGVALVNRSTSRDSSG